MIRIVLADDELLLRSAMAQLLPFEADIEVLAEASDGQQAVAATQQHEPDVLVLDLEMPIKDGLQALEEVRQIYPGQPVIVLTRHAKPGALRKALHLGAQGFVSKGSDPALVAEAIQRVHAGGRWIDPEVLSVAVTDDCPLTEREKDVLRETGEGFSAAEIARRLFLAEGTVRNYLSSAIAKTHATTRHEASRFARERGWI